MTLQIPRWRRPNFCTVTGLATLFAQIAQKLLRGTEFLEHIEFYQTQTAHGWPMVSAVWHFVFYPPGNMLVILAAVSLLFLGRSRDGADRLAIIDAAKRIVGGALTVKPVNWRKDRTLDPVPWPSQWTHRAWVLGVSNEASTVLLAKRAERVVARISLLDQDRASIREVRFGAWLAASSHEVSFDPGELHDLVIALARQDKPEEWNAVEDNRGIYSSLGVRMIPLLPMPRFARIKFVVDGVAQEVQEFALDLLEERR